VRTIQPRCAEYLLRKPGSRNRRSRGGRYRETKHDCFFFLPLLLRAHGVQAKQRRLTCAHPALLADFCRACDASRISAPAHVLLHAAIAAQSVAFWPPQPLADAAALPDSYVPGSEIPLSPAPPLRVAMHTRYSSCTRVLAITMTNWTPTCKRLAYVPCRGAEYGDLNSALQVQRCPGPLYLHQQHGLEKIPPSHAGRAGRFHGQRFVCACLPAYLPACLYVCDLVATTP